MMFSAPPTLIPDPYNPLDWNWYGYARYNPIRYTDATGHWTEDELVAMLGEDWRESISAKKTVDPFNLYVVEEFFRLASYMNSMGVNLDDYDAIGCRFTGMLGYGGVAGGNADAVLNTSSGELSFFSAIDAGAGYGATAGAGAGYFVVKNLPSNDQYRGAGKSIGTSLAYHIGANVEEFFGGEVNGNSNVYSALYAGGVVGEGFSFYGTASYTFLEALCVNQTGYNFFPYFNRDPVNIITEMGDMLWNNIFRFGEN